LFCFLISDASKETLGGGEKKLDELFTNKKGDEATYFVSKALGIKRWMLGLLVGVPLLLKMVRSPPRDMNLKT